MIRFIENQVLNYRSCSLRIVYYHIVSDSNPEHYFSNKALSVQGFRDHIKFFKRRYDIISLDEAIQLADNNQSLKNKLVITFDDGFHENYSIIAPILLENNIRATFFVISGCIDNQDLMWRNKILLFNKYVENMSSDLIQEISHEFEVSPPEKDQDLMQWSFLHWPMSKKELLVNRIWEQTMPFSLSSYLEKHKPYCTKSQIIELSNEGFGIGTHSHTHPIFNRLSFDEFSEEIELSTKILEKIIGKEINTFSYPFGERSDVKFETQFQEKTNKKWVFLGTKNKLNNFVSNSMQWERDNIEHSNLEMKLRFLYLPIYRSLKKMK